MLSKNQEIKLKEYLLSEYNAENLSTNYIMEQDALLSSDDEDGNNMNVIIEDELVYVYINDVIQEDVFNISRICADDSPRDPEINIPVIDVGEVS